MIVRNVLHQKLAPIRHKNSKIMVGKYPINGSRFQVPKRGRAVKTGP